jgi:hypothetical protein
MLTTRMAAVLGLVCLAVSIATSQPTGQLPPAGPAGEPMPARMVLEGMPRTVGDHSLSFTATIDFLLPPHRIYNIQPEDGIEFEIRGVVAYQRHLRSNCRMAAGLPTGNINIVARGYRHLANSDEGKRDWITLPATPSLPQMGTEQEICTTNGRENVYPIIDPTLVFMHMWPDLLRVFDNFSLELNDPVQRYSITLKLACPLQPPTPDDAPQIRVTPPDGAWPLRVDHTKTGAEITALAESLGRPSRGSVLAGLTILGLVQINIKNIEWKGVDETFGGGRCWWIPSVEIAFPEIEIYVDSKYPEGSCEYNAMRQHEEKHYEAIVNTARVYQELIRENLLSITILNIPTQRHPAYSASETGMIPTVEALRDFLLGTLTTMADQIKAEGELLDQELNAVSAQCNDW